MKHPPDQPPDTEARARDLIAQHLAAPPRRHLVDRPQAPPPRTPPRRDATARRHIEQQHLHLLYQALEPHILALIAITREASARVQAGDYAHPAVRAWERMGQRLDSMMGIAPTQAAGGGVLAQIYAPGATIQFAGPVGQVLAGLLSSGGSEAAEGLPEYIQVGSPGEDTPVDSGG